MKIGNQRGLTLLELLLSIVILGIISTCVISVALTSTRVSSRTNESLFSANITYNIHELWLDHTFNDTYPSYESFFNTLAMFYDAENLASDDALSGLDSPLSVDSGSFSLQPFVPDPVLPAPSTKPLLPIRLSEIMCTTSFSRLLGHNAPMATASLFMPLSPHFITKRLLPIFP